MLTHLARIRHFTTALTVLNVLLPVEEPIWDLVLAGVLHDGDDLLDLLFGELAGALREVYVGLLEHDVGVAAANSLDGRHSEHDVPLAVDVGVHHTEDVLEVGGDHQRHLGGRGGGLPGSETAKRIERVIISVLIGFLVIKSVLRIKLN